MWIIIFNPSIPPPQKKERERERENFTCLAEVGNGKRGAWDTGIENDDEE